MPIIELSKHEKEAIVSKMKSYFMSELDQEIAQFDAEFLLDFFIDKIGPYFYNRGVADAQSVVESKVEDISEALYAIEKPIPAAG